MAVAMDARVLLVGAWLGLLGCDDSGCRPVNCAPTVQLSQGVVLRGVTTPCAPAGYYGLLVPPGQTWEVAVTPDPEVVALVSVEPEPAGVDAGAVDAGEGDGGASAAVCPAPPDCNEVPSACVSSQPPVRVRALTRALRAVVRVVTPSNLIGYRYGGYQVTVRLAQ